MKSFWVFGLSCILIAAGTLVSTRSPAYDVCVASEEPSCIGSRYAFENELSATRCRREVDRYVREIEGYIACLQRVREDYLQRASIIMTRLNCRLHGDLQC